MALAQVGAYTPAFVAVAAAAVCTVLAPAVAVACKLVVAAAVLVELPGLARLPGKSTLHISGRRRHCLLSQSYSWGRG